MKVFNKFLIIILVLISCITTNAYAEKIKIEHINFLANPVKTTFTVSPINIYAIKRTFTKHTYFYRKILKTNPITLGNFSHKYFDFGTIFWSFQQEYDYAQTDEKRQEVLQKIVKYLDEVNSKKYDHVIYN